jgi:hypothetical protein
MMFASNWEKWNAEYPAETIECLSDFYSGPFKYRCQAEYSKDALEMSEERGCYKVVKHNSQFYVI